MTPVPPATEQTATGRSRGLALPLALVMAAYLVLVSVFTFNIGAWESNDESDHAQYVEYVLRTGHRPPIHEGRGVEVHQGPLYYYLVAGWQKVLGIEPFDPQPIPTSQSGPVESMHHILYHPKHGPSHEQAKWLHLLRLVSVAAGACTVALSFALGWLVTRRRAVAIAVGATVAVWPRFLVVNAGLTNSSLAATFCAATAVSSLLWSRSGSRRWAAVAGLAGGAAVLTQVTTLPLVALVLGVAAVSRLRSREWVTPAIATGVLLGVCGWWFVSNAIHYGDPFANQATDAMLRHYFGDALVRPHATFTPEVLRFSATELSKSLWYQGGWNQLLLPKVIYVLLDGLGVLSLAGLLRMRRRLSPTAAMMAVGSLVSWATLAATTTQATGRYLLIGAPAWALGLVVGASALLPRFRGALALWPLALLAVDGYVLGTEVLRYPAF